MSVTIHPTAIIDPKAELADGVSVGPYSVIEGDVVIGKDTQVYTHAFIGKGARIGERCHIHHSAVVSNVPQDLKFKGTEETYVYLGDDCTVREFATIHRATIHDADTNAGTMDGTTRVGAGSLIMAYAHIAHDCLVGEGVILANAVQLAGHVTVEKWTTIGGGSLVHQFSLIGALSMVGGGAEVRKDIPPYSLIGGGDAKFSGINRIGLQRRGKDAETILAIRSAYNTLYSAGMNVSDAVRSLSSGDIAGIPEVQHIINFIGLSKRGIVGQA